MSTKKRILFIANEMSPYLELTEFSEIVNRLAIKSNDNNFEVRCIMPRFGVINERRHRLHEVVRLSGINVTVDNEDFPLQIKVASLPNARLQIYFLENEDLFKRKFVFTDENDEWFDDNWLRTIFYCKGALETVKKFGWPPDIIHCSGWMTGLIPMYLKTAYKKEPVFGNPGCCTIYPILSLKAVSLISYTFIFCTALLSPYTSVYARLSITESIPTILSMEVKGLRPLAAGTTERYICPSVLPNWGSSAIIPRA